VSALYFLLLDIFKDGVQIVIEARSVGIANSSNFLDNRVIHGFDSISSSGVQMIGAFNPLAAQTDSIIGRSAAFARWRQFQVIK
jgi:hypothetical protein